MSENITEFYVKKQMQIYQRHLHRKLRKMHLDNNCNLAAGEITLLFFFKATAAGKTGNVGFTAATGSAENDSCRCNFPLFATATNTTCRKS